MCFCGGHREDRDGKVSVENGVIVLKDPEGENLL